MDHSGPGGAPRLLPRGGGGGGAPPPLVPRGSSGKAPLPPPEPDGAGIGAISMEQIYVTDEIKGQPWFVGNVDRAFTEQLLKTGKRSGNFLVREKVPNKTFVHSYLSLTRMIIVHNLVEFSRDGTCKVDGKPWPHSAAPSLEDVIDTMQEIRRSRKGTKLNGDPGTFTALSSLWRKICPVGQTLTAIRRQVRVMRPTSFMACMDQKAGLNGYVLLICLGEKKVHEAMCCKSSSGYYLKYSELAGDTIEQLVAVILSNAPAAATTGVPRMRIPSESELDAPPPPASSGRRASNPANAAPALPSRNSVGPEDIYDDGDGEDIYEDGDGEDIYEDGDGDTYEDIEEPLPQNPGGGAPPLPGRRAAPQIPQEEDIYDD